MKNKEAAKKQVREMTDEFTSNIKLVKVFLDAAEQGLGDLMIDVLIEELEKMKTKTPAANESD